MYGGNTNLSLIIQTSVKFRDFVELFFVSFLEQIVPTLGSFNDFKKLKTRRRIHYTTYRLRVKSLYSSDHLCIVHLLEVYFKFLIGLVLNDYDLNREEIQASYQVLQPQYNLGTPGQLVIPGSESISH